MKITVAHSPDSDDAFMFYGLASGAVPTGDLGARVFVDPKSHKFLDGTVLDYDTALLSKGFLFHNPNATGTCGCGTSFSV